MTIRDVHFQQITSYKSLAWNYKPGSWEGLSSSSHLFPIDAGFPSFIFYQGGFNLTLSTCRGQWAHHHGGLLNPLLNDSIRRSLIILISTLISLTSCSLPLVLVCGVTRGRSWQWLPDCLLWKLGFIRLSLLTVQEKQGRNWGFQLIPGLIPSDLLGTMFLLSWTWTSVYKWGSHSNIPASRSLLGFLLPRSDRFLPIFEPGSVAFLPTFWAQMTF